MQASAITLEQDRVHLRVRLLPGIAVFPQLLAEIDVDQDAVISDKERLGYAARVRQDLLLTIDGNPVSLRLVASSHADIMELREGLGAIQLDYEAMMPMRGNEHRLAYENHHKPSISVYLVNTLVPPSPAFRVLAQHRDREQSTYELDYAATAVAVGSASAARLTRERWKWGAVATLLLLAGWVARRQLSARLP